MTRTRTRKRQPIKRRTRKRQRGTGIDIQKLLGKTGIEFHWPGYQYMGTSQEKTGPRRSWDQPTGQNSQDPLMILIIYVLRI